MCCLLAIEPGRNLERGAAELTEGWDERKPSFGAESRKEISHVPFSRLTSRLANFFQFFALPYLLVDLTTLLTPYSPTFVQKSCPSGDQSLRALSSLFSESRRSDPRRRRKGDGAELRLCSKREQYSSIRDNNREKMMIRTKREKKPNNKQGEGERAGCERE